MDIFKLGDKILALLEMVFGFWNNQVSLVFAMLGQSPTAFKGGGPWAAIEKINPLFVAVGSSLVVLFFVIGFCAESVDIKEDMRFETILRMLIRVGISEWLVTNNVTIMKAFFTTIGNIVNSMSAGSDRQCPGRYNKGSRLWRESCDADTYSLALNSNHNLRILYYIHSIFQISKAFGDSSSWFCRLFYSWRKQNSSKYCSNLCKTLLLEETEQ